LSGTITAEHLTTSDDLTVGDRITTEYIDVNLGLTVNKDNSPAGDFQVKSNNLNRAIFSDANKDRVGIGWGTVTGNDLSSSLHVSGGITATQITASYFKGDGSSITGVTAEWDGTHNGDAEITGSLIIKDGTLTTDFANIEKLYPPTDMVPTT
jgi:hypothetical protein